VPRVGNYSDPLGILTDLAAKCDLCATDSPLPPNPNPTPDCIWILNYGTRLDFLAGNGPNFVLELICALLPELLLTFLHKAAYKSHLPNAGSTDQSSMAE